MLRHKECTECRYKRLCDEDRDMGLEVYCMYQNDEYEEIVFDEEDEDEEENGKIEH